MGVVQNSINQIIGSTTTAAGLARGVGEMKKQNTLKKLDAEADYLKGESERNQESENLDRLREQSKIDADKAAEDAAAKKDTADILSGVFLPDDKEGQRLIKESEEKAKLAQAMAEAKKKEKLNNYRYIRDRQKFLERQGQVAKERAKIYGLDIDALKGGKK